jgi:hypothetical protein
MHGYNFVPECKYTLSVYVCIYIIILYTDIYNTYRTTIQYLQLKGLVKCRVECGPLDGGGGLGAGGEHPLGQQLHGHVGIAQALQKKVAITCICFIWITQTCHKVVFTGTCFIGIAKPDTNVAVITKLEVHMLLSITHTIKGSPNRDICICNRHLHILHRGGPSV